LNAFFTLSSLAIIKAVLPYEFSMYDSLSKSASHFNRKFTALG
jgi:hypothetical protein